MPWFIARDRMIVRCCPRVLADKCTDGPRGTPPGRVSLATLDRNNVMQRCVNVLAMVKDGERFVFLYDDDSIPETLQTLGRFAADPELNFTWYDAAVLCQKLRDAQTTQQTRTFFRESA